MEAEHQSRVVLTHPASRIKDQKGKSVIVSAPNIDSSIAGPDLHVVGGAAPRSGIEQLLPGSVHVPSKADLSYRGKRIFDIAAAAFFGLLLSPLITVIVLLIRLGGEPVLFRHKRIGHNGRTFYCLKFRTMVQNAEQVLRDMLRDHPELRDEWTTNHKLRQDPRVTRIGRFLRLTSLDELPQLWNIIQGDMSLVGPRPVVRAELLRYGRKVAHYLAVKPGLTGLWQVKGRSDTTYRRRVAMDTYYVHNQSILFDLRILAATAAAVWRRAGAY